MSDPPAPKPIDPLTGRDDLPRLGLAMQALPGAYALLLGSGLSSSSGIPTGHGVTVDLIRRLAHDLNVSPDPSPEAWFIERYGTEPSYSVLLKKLAPSAHERSAILRRYFEANGEERQAGLKQPTRAHRAIAELVASGHIRVILTTNFDRLLETALEVVGVRPVVISTPSAAQGASPLQHNACTIVKLHGDYLDPHIKNTVEELSTYSRSLNRLLDRVFDEYGLVVCGWSAQWDPALRQALERCKSHRFTTYWASRSPLGAVEDQLAGLRRAVRIPIADADTFFDDLAATIRRITETTLPGQAAGRATTPQALVRELERMADDPTKRLALRRLLDEQAQALADAIEGTGFTTATSQPQPTEATLAERMKAYEELSASALALMAAGADYLASPSQIGNLIALIRSVSRHDVVGGYTAYISLRSYPALLLLYAGGMGALRSNNYDTAYRLWMTRVSPVDGGPEDRPAVVELRPGKVIDAAVAQSMLETKRLVTPVSEYLFKVLREPLRNIVRADVDYDLLFDRFEFLSAMLSVDATREGYTPSFHIGRFGWKPRSSTQTYVGKLIEQEIKDQQAAWPLLMAGGFDRDPARALAALETVNKTVSRLPWF